MGRKLDKYILLPFCEHAKRLFCCDSKTLQAKQGKLGKGLEYIVSSEYYF
jgi:hypothetical protein